MLSRRRFIQLSVLSGVGILFLYDGPYAGLEIENFLDSKTHMTVRIEGIEGLPYHDKRHVAPPAGGGGWGYRNAFPAALPATYHLTIDVRNGPSETFRIGFGVNDGNQSVHATIRENGEITIEKEHRPLAIP